MKPEEVVKKEAQYWDDFYTAQIEEKGRLVGLDRLLPREKYIFSFLREKIKGKRLLEVGCGSGATVAKLMNPRKYGYKYFGVDVSTAGIKIAKALMPGEFFLQDMTKLSFPKESFDVILSLGSIHHSEQKEEIVKYLFPFLKKGGYFVLHEPLERPGFLGKIFRKSLFWIKESPHEERLDEDKLLNISKKLGTIVSVHKEYSPVRTFLAVFLGRVFKDSRRFFEMTFWLDDLVIRTIGNVLPAFNGGTILLVIKKQN